jgi:hypothetical protein
MRSFTKIDEDNYDIESVNDGNRFVLDWQASTTIEQMPADIARIEVTKMGHYSEAGVTQDFYLYNFQNADWELVDSSVVSNEDDLPVITLIDNQTESYVSEAGELRVRIRAVKESGQMSSWSNVLFWEVSEKPQTEEERSLPETNEEAESVIETSGGTVSWMLLLLLLALRMPHNASAYDRKTLP